MRFALWDLMNSKFFFSCEKCVVVLCYSIGWKEEIISRRKSSYRPAVDDESSSNESKSSTFVGEEDDEDDEDVVTSSVSGANVGSFMLTFPLSLLLLLSISFLSSSKSSKSSSLLLDVPVDVPPPPRPPLRSKIGPNVRTKNCIIICIFCSIIYTGTGGWVFKYIQSSVFKIFYRCRLKLSIKES